MRGDYRVLYRFRGNLMVAHIDAAASLHEQIVRAVRACRDAEHRLAHLLARLDVEKGWREFGHASLGEYARVQHGLEPRKARALAQIGRALPDLPLLDAAMAAGDVPYTKIRELLPVVVPETEALWLEKARSSTNRQLERLVASASIGEEPPGSAALAPAAGGPRVATLVLRVGARLSRAGPQRARRRLRCRRRATQREGAVACNRVQARAGALSAWREAHADRRAAQRRADRADRFISR